MGSKAFGGLHRRLKEKTAESRWFETTDQAPFGRAKAAYWKINLSMRTDNQDQLGEWSIRPGENVVLQERGERIKVRPNYKITVGDGGDWVDVGQIGQFRNGTWYVNVRDVWAAAHQDRPAGRDGRSGEGQPREPSPRSEDSALDQILKRIK